MSQSRRTWIAVTLGVLAFALYAADLLGLKPPPRIIPSVVLAAAAVVIGVTARRPAPADGPHDSPPGTTATTDDGAPGAAATAHGGARAAGNGAPMVPAQADPTVGRLLVIAGLTLHLLLVVPIVPIGLVAPAQGMLAVHGAWLVGFAIAWRLRRSNPPLVLAVPFATAAVIAAVLWVGTTQLGWQP